VVKASGHLKQSLAANSDLSKWLESKVAERAKEQQEATEAECRMGEVKAEMARVAAENTQLKKMVEERDEKLSSSATELATLKAARDEAKAEAELDRNFDQTKELLK